MPKVATETKAPADVQTANTLAPEPSGASASMRALAATGYDAATAALTPEKAPAPAVGSGTFAVDAAAGKALARDIVKGGLREESAVTDAVFYGLFPQLAGAKLKANSAEAKAWLDVRRVAVRPVLLEPIPANEDSADKAEPTPTPTPADASDTSKDKAPKPPTPTPTPVPVPSPDKDEPTLAGSVGAGGANAAADVAWVTERLARVGIATGSGEKELTAAIKAYENRALNRTTSLKGVVKPNDYIHHALLAGASPAPLNVADPAALVAASDVPAVVALRAAVLETRAFRNSIHVDQGEEGGAKDGTGAADRDLLVKRLAALRAQVVGLNLAGVASEEARAIKAWGFREINELSPYYSQGRNANILEGKSTRTCNLTSLAMTLEALGISAANYAGDMNLIAQIRSASTAEGGATRKELDKAWGKNEEKQGVDGLRLPDFLQLVAVANEMEKGKSLMKSLESAWNAILSPENLRTYATRFGVNAWIRYGTGSAKGKSKKEQWQATLGAELDAGRQVVMLIPGHFVRLQAVVDDGVIVDDPATGTKKNRPMPFDEVKSYKMVVLG